MDRIDWFWYRKLINFFLQQSRLPSVKRKQNIQPRHIQKQKEKDFFFLSYTHTHTHTLSLSLSLFSIFEHNTLLWFDITFTTGMFLVWELGDRDYVELLGGVYEAASELSVCTAEDDTIPLVSFQWLVDKSRVCGKTRLQ